MFYPITVVMCINTVIGYSIKYSTCVHYYSHLLYICFVLVWISSFIIYVYCTMCILPTLSLFSVVLVLYFCHKWLMFYSTLNQWHHISLVMHSSHLFLLAKFTFSLYGLKLHIFNKNGKLHIYIYIYIPTSKRKVHS